MPGEWAADMGISLDPRADVPLGVQLDWAMRSAIAAGRLRPGDRLPALRDLARDLGVNHNTVRAAVARLERDGFLHTRHGAGTFVADPAPLLPRFGALVDQAATLAADAGVSRRELAGALWVAASVPPAADAGAFERRRLRDEIAVLERLVSELGAPREAAPRSGSPSNGRTPRPRLLTAEELREQRNALVARLASAHAAPPRTAPQRGGAQHEAPEAAPAPHGQAVRAAPRRPRPGIAPA